MNHPVLWLTQDEIEHIDQIVVCVLCLVLFVLLTKGSLIAGFSLCVELCILAAWAGAKNADAGNVRY